jgi:hypothetical protein
MSNNVNKIEGVIYSRPVRTANGKKGTKNEGKVFEFPSIILEVKREHKGVTYVELPEFELGKGVNIDDFAVKDSVEITFALSGKKIGDWHKTSAKALYIRHLDIEGDDTRDVGRQDEKKRETVFVPPNPTDDEEFNDLPF